MDFVFCKNSTFMMEMSAGAITSSIQDVLFFVSFLLSWHQIMNSDIAEMTWCLLNILKMARNKLLTVLRNLARLFSTAKAIFKFFAFH
jgi:hypothetical protein